jgi:hypothetical protein
MHQLFTTPGGDCCVNGHGGADPLESKHYPDIEGQPVRAGDQYAPAHVGLDSITCDGHKYTFVEERTGGFRIDRHGEEWVSRRDLLDVPGSNAFTALFFEAVNLKRRNSDLECELEILRKRRG